MPLGCVRQKHLSVCISAAADRQGSHPGCAARLLPKPTGLCAVCRTDWTPSGTSRLAADFDDTHGRGAGCLENILPAADLNISKGQVRRDWAILHLPKLYYSTPSPIKWSSICSRILMDQFGDIRGKYRTRDIMAQTPDDF